MKKLPIGRDNFKQIIEGKFYYVNKTKMIEDLLEEGSYVILFPRPSKGSIKAYRKQWYDQIIEGKANISQYEKSFKILSYAMNQYYKENVILL